MLRRAAAGKASASFCWRYGACAFVKAAGEFNDPNHPVHRACAEHKRMIIDYLADLAAAAGTPDP